MNTFWKILALLLSLFGLKSSFAAPIVVTPFIKVDQFGYFCGSQKVAVIADPQVGFNAAQSYNPGIGSMQYQVRRWSDDLVVFAGTLLPWNSGQTHSQSGDKGWWFDFTSLTMPGSYYIFDLGTNSGSYRFEVGSSVYDEVLKQASRTFFYQRSNFAKQTPFADSRWTDGAAFDRLNQDRFARSRWNKNSPETAKDVSGGWFDAGDLNKYVTNTVEPLTQLLEAYRKHPRVFLDNLNIPESGNGIPDILDEVKWEIDWLKKMQDATQTNGLCLKVGSDNYSLFVPPSSDINNRYYLPECTSATLSGAVIFAMAANVYRELNSQQMVDFANDLQSRALAAWTRAKETTANFTTFQTACDDQEIKSGSADQNDSWQKQCVLTAAVHLYEATRGGEFRNYIESNYNKVEPVGTGWWGPYRLFMHKAMFRYSELIGADSEISIAIRNSKLATQTGTGVSESANRTDLYRAHMLDGNYTWGSNMTKSACGNIALDYALYNIQPNKKAEYFTLGEQYLHWLHGVNPMSIVMLSNMYAFGGDSCVNEIYHSWFSDGTIYDNAKLSERGPVPGYLVGGPNAYFSVASISPPSNQPVQKMFRDWNTGWDGIKQQSSFEISEPAIYYQAMYIELLASLIDSREGICNIQVLPNNSIELKGRISEDNSATLSWNTLAFHSIELQKRSKNNNFQFESSFPLSRASSVQVYKDPLKIDGSIEYRLAITDEHQIVSYSNIILLNSLKVRRIKLIVNVEQKLLSVTSDFSGLVEFQVSTIDGKKLRSGKISLMANVKYPISLHGLPKGQYFCYLISSQSRKVVKFVL